MQDFERLGEFYLGREHDLAAGVTKDRPLLYDSKDLTTHAVCVGMTGSGKTGLCLSLLEEAAVDGVPAIAIDPKGDLGNLLLAFPQLQPSDFEPWIDPNVAARKALTVSELAEQTASLWKNGLQKWNQGGDRISRFNAAVDKAIYTPGSSAGLPLTILKSFSAPPPAVMDDGDAFREQVQSSASGVLALLGIDADPVKSREHILLSNVLTEAWQRGESLDLPRLIRAIQNPPFQRVGVVDLETFFPADKRLELGMQLNNLLASPSFASWLEGDPLRAQDLLYTATGRPRLSIISIAHLNESERMFFVTILLNEVVSWMRTQPGTSSLRALLYMDEVFGYFPPTANPPSKRPMLTLLKQARAFGVGCVLATQNPVDLDYKGLSNAGTWFLGRLQTERDKMRVIEGLEGVSADADSKFDRGKMEATLAGLGNRVFLMNNVHDPSSPKVFHTRWAMSYLRGPLTRDQIAELMKDRKAERAAAAASASAADQHDLASSPASELRGKASPSPEPGAHGRLVISAEIPQRYCECTTPRPLGAKAAYRPALLGMARLHYVRARLDIDAWRDVTVLQEADHELTSPVWESATVLDSPMRAEDQPHVDASFVDPPSGLTQVSNYRSWKKELKDYLYSTERKNIYECEALDACSDVGESEADFRIRMTQRARVARDEAKENVRTKFRNKIRRQQAQVEKAESYLQEQKSQFLAKAAQVAWSVGEMVLRTVGGSKSRRRFSTSGAQQAMRERSQASRAELRLEQELEELAHLEQQQQEALEQIEFEFLPNQLELEAIELAPRKADIAVDEVALAWLPWWRLPDGTAQPAFVQK